MKDIEELLKNHRNLDSQAQLLFKEVCKHIAQANLKESEIVYLLSDITTDYVQDILKNLLSDGYINDEQFDYINEGLKSIYVKEYLASLKSNKWLSRVSLKTYKDKRLLTKNEILVIYLTKTLECDNLLFGNLTGDEFFDPLIEAFQSLSQTRKNNYIYQRLKNDVSCDVEYILSKIEKVKVEL